LLFDERGRWRWDGELHAPARVAELIAAQLAALPEDQRRALDLVALGEPLEWPMLCGLATEAVAERLLSNGLIVVASEREQSVVRLSHPLVGDVARETLTEPARRRLLRELAATIAIAADPVAHDALRRATWLLEIGEAVDTNTLVAAAQHC